MEKVRNIKTKGEKRTENNELLQRVS